MANCIKCTSELPRGKTQCSTCGAWNMGAEDPAAAKSTMPVLNPSNNFGSVTLDEVVSADVDRVHTGPWDVCFGRAEHDDGSLGDAGIVRGSTNLIGGSPGAGKSTLFLQMSVNILTATDKEVLYISAEEQLPQISARAKRLRIPPEILKRIRMVDVRKGGAEVAAILKHFQFVLLFLDSLKAIAGDDDMMQIEVCKVVKEYCTFQHAPGVISHHVTKDDAIAGLMALQHEVDSTHTFFPDAERIIRSEKDPETIRAEQKLVKLGKMAGPVIPYVDEAVRVLEVQKNRNGPAFTQCELLMTSRGLVPYTDEEDESE